MRVLLLATDEQPKLPALTDVRPAPLLTVANRPVMATTVEILARAGHKDLLVSLFNRGGQIAAYFGTGQRWGVQISYVAQRHAWGTAGALKWAEHLLTETMLVLPADQVFDLDVDTALEFHRAHGGLATVILATGREPLVAPIALDQDGRICATDAVTRVDHAYSHTGAYIFEPQVLQQIQPQTESDCYRDLLPALLAAAVPVYGYVATGYWNPLLTAHDYQEAQRVFLYSAYYQSQPDAADPQAPSARVRYPSLRGRQVVPGIWVGSNPIIHLNVKMAPPLSIGENCWVGRNVELAPGSVIGTNVIIGDDATIYDSTVLANTYVGKMVQLSNRIVNGTTIVDPATEYCVEVVDPFLLAQINPALSGAHAGRRLLARGLAGCLLLLLAPVFFAIGLLLLIIQGRVLRRSLHISHRLAPEHPGQPARLATVPMLTFETRTQAGPAGIIGRWLEHNELHRLPELLNVVAGELALVGTRPLKAEEVSSLTEEWRQKRYECPAGFTGLWYTQAEPDSDLDTVLVADAYYSATRSWKGDIKVLCNTPVVWLRRHRPRQEPATPELITHADKAASQ